MAYSRSCSCCRSFRKPRCNSPVTGGGRAAEALADLDERAAVPVAQHDGFALVLGQDRQRFGQADSPFVPLDLRR